LSDVDARVPGVVATRGRERTEGDVVTMAEVDLVTDIAADLHADIGARDVVEPHAVQGTDLHVFDRLGLYGEIGGLCSRESNGASRGNQEKTFHHLHCCSSMFTSVGGSGLRREQLRPLRRSP